jgi:uncharacterized protein YjbI with pentapeptide repeats
VRLKLVRLLKKWLRRKRQNFIRRLDRSVCFRILLSFLGAYIVLFSVDLIDRYLPDKQTCKFSLACAIAQFAFLVSVDNLQSFGILVVSCLYLIESRDRKKQKHYEAWQVIDSAAAAKVPTSYARLKALQDLNEDGVSLCGIDIPRADLKRIDLSNADLRQATLSGADLKEANLKEANLKRAILNGADLEEVNLFEANLEGINLKGANLAKANLKGANLANANLNKANLTQANLEGVNLVEANLAEAILRDANLKQANLKDARLRESHFRSADFKGAILTGAIMPSGAIYHQDSDRASGF